MKTGISIIGTLGVGALIVFIFARGMLSLFTPSDQTANISSSQTIIQSVKSLGQLVTVRAQVAKAGISVVTQFGIWDFCRIGADHVAQGTIEGGVDLSSISEDNITDEPDLITLRLPEARLTGCYIDPVVTQQYNRWGANVACNTDFDDMRRLASFIAVTEFRDDAVEGGLLQEAQNQAETLLYNFIKSLTGKEVVIEFVSSTDEMALPQSCDPTPPGVWTFNEERSIWINP